MIKTLKKATLRENFHSTNLEGQPCLVPRRRYSSGKQGALALWGGCKTPAEVHHNIIRRDTWERGRRQLLFPGFFGRFWGGALIA